jgi:DNA-binding protein HU-beta/integration host factor subunit beta
MARNPRTGERVPVQAKSVVTFKPGKEMEARVRQLDQVEVAQPGEPSAQAAPDLEARPDQEARPEQEAQPGQE